MKHPLLRLRQRRVPRVAVALAISLTTIPVVLGALVQPVAAATTPANSTISAQQVVADVECDIAWVEYDYAWTYTPAPTPPSCAFIPDALQQSIANLLYSYCEFTNALGGSHGICIPPAFSPND